jgi:hypothetical protein
MCRNSVQIFKKYQKYVIGDIGRCLRAVFEKKKIEVMLKNDNEGNFKIIFYAENRKE